MKGGIVSGAAYAGGLFGGSVGFAAGAAIPGPDLTGIPEAGGAVSGALAGGYAFGNVASKVVDFFLGP